ncbi:hypothetical protein, partial [Candidatus Accumulibacter phosphatis]|uniref:hypothetical protein n=1 Tax=Candidatus Accumulibacter phosphatis TaxID=327160 RepID=UPI001BB24E57
KQRAATSRFPRHVKSFLYFFEKFLRRRNVFGIRWRLRVSKLQLSVVSNRVKGLLRRAGARP